MKQTKLYAFILMAALAIGLNTSCSKDDDNEGEKPVSGSGASLIKTIKDKDGNAVQLDEFTYASHTYKYFYSESGKLNKMIDEIDGTVFKPTLINSPFNITYKESTSSNDVSYDWNTDIKLDGEGDITSYTTTENTTKKGGSFMKVEETATFTYGYSKEIKLVNISGKFVENTSSIVNTKYNITIKFTWDSGNITEANVTELVDGKENYPTISYSYSSGTLTSNQMPYNFVRYGILGNYSYSDQIYAFLPLIGFGKTPQNVPYSAGGHSINLYRNSNGTISSENNCSYVYATK